MKIVSAIYVNGVHLGTAADKMPYCTGVDVWAECALTSFGRSLIDDADAAAGRTTLGLGTSAVIDTGTSGTKVALTDGANQWSSAQRFINSSGILILDTNASHTLGIIVGSDLTANRTLTITPGDASRTLTLTADASIGGTNTGDQTSVSGNAGTVTVGDAGADTTTWVLLGTSQTGNLSPATDAGLTYNASTNALTATTFVGALTGNADTATSATTVTNINISTTDGNTSDTTMFPVLVGANATGNQLPHIDAGLSYNASTNALTATTFVGALTGNADTATSATTATGATNINISTTDGNTSDTTMFPVLVGANATGNQLPHIDAGLSYNASTNALTATTFVGALTGNADTATTATNANNINISTTDGNSSDTTMFPVLVGAGTTGNQAPHTDAGLTYNASTNTLTAGNLSGTNTGDVAAASTTEVLTGTDATKTVTSDSLAALWEKSADVASSGTISLGEGGYFFITGTTTITDIDFATDKAGRWAWVKFAGSLTLTHNVSTLILPGLANITTLPGDTALFISEGSDVVRCVSYNTQSWTGTGNEVHKDSPTLVTPQIADYTNATHTHQNNATGGTLNASAIAAGTMATARLGSGTATIVQALRGDQTWAKTQVLIQEQTASNSAQIDFTNLSSTYKTYVVKIIDVIPATNTAYLHARFTTDGGSTWKSGASDYNTSTHIHYYSGGLQHSTTGDDTSAFMLISHQISNNTGHGLNADVWIYDPSNSSTLKKIQGLTVQHYTAAIMFTMNIGGCYNTTGAVNGIRFYMSSGNITSGTFQLWGYP